MDRKGDFSKNLFSLQLQLNTLLEEAGGESALGLLDSLCKLSRSEQKIALGLFQRTIEKIASGELRLETDEDNELVEFEDNLFNGIMDDIRSRLFETRNGKKLSVLDGGKLKPELSAVQENDSIIDFEAARKAKLGIPSKPVIN